MISVAIGPTLAMAILVLLETIPASGPHLIVVEGNIGTVDLPAPRSNAGRSVVLARWLGSVWGQSATAGFSLCAREREPAGGARLRSARAHSAQADGGYTALPLPANARLIGSISRHVVTTGQIGRATCGLSFTVAV